MTDKTLKELLQEGVERFNNSGKPTTIIDNAIEKLFKDIIDSEFRSYGNFGEIVRDAVKKALPANIQDIISLPKYNQLIVNSLQQQWLSSGVEQHFVDKATNLLNDIINEYPIPEYIYLSDLLEAFVEEYVEDAEEERWDRPDIRLEVSDYDSGHIRVYFDKKPGANRSCYSLDNILACSRLDEKVIDKLELNECEVYKVYSAKIDGDCIGKLLQPTNTKYQNLIIALYYGQSKLVFDCDVDDIVYPNDCD
ncbi:hypothetical protein A9G13_02205 [Gilliamella sp. wkB178]|uniref:hypothetical protein n=1 Tax=Gilliamella sp. wkB178 TaxID=3120259 RepID=UPI00080E1CE6|nr:hypothetical protein [Gilliamella apicola]OCG08896.1 hypothetical protein A9G13_02205 [Gilliamella apicola]